MFIVDAHLDLAYNAIDRGRDVTRPARTPTLTPGPAFNNVDRISIPSKPNSAHE